MSSGWVCLGQGWICPEGREVCLEGWVCPGEGGYIQGWVYHGTWDTLRRGYTIGPGIPTHPQVLAPSGSHQNTYDCQAGRMHSTGMHSCFYLQMKKNRCVSMRSTWPPSR